MIHYSLIELAFFARARRSHENDGTRSETIRSSSIRPEEKQVFKVSFLREAQSQRSQRRESTDARQRIRPPGLEGNSAVARG